MESRGTQCGAEQPLDDFQQEERSAASSEDVARIVRIMRRIDEGAFCVGVGNLVLTLFLVFRQPEFYWLFWLAKAVVLIFWRWLTYRRQRSHYFLLDFCYLVNLLLLVLCVAGLARGSHTHSYAHAHAHAHAHRVWGWAEGAYQRLFRVLFAWATGPVTLSILVFRNSLVFHSRDHLTSLFVHASPSILVWTFRWYGDRLAARWPSTFDFCPGAVPWRDLVLLPVPVYLCLWALPYYWVVFVARARRISEREYSTLYRYTTDLYRPVRRLTDWAGPRLGPVVYMLLHFLFCSLTGCLAPLWWRSYWAHTAYVVAVLWGSVWNGSTFYFEVFAERYAQAVLVQSARRRKLWETTRYQHNTQA